MIKITGEETRLGEIHKGEFFLYKGDVCLLLDKVKYSSLKFEASGFFLTYLGSKSRILPITVDISATWEIIR